MDSTTPSRIHLHRQSGILELVFGNTDSFNLPCEYLRVYSPSAEVRGHGPGQEVLQTGKRLVKLIKIEPVGNYGLKLTFDDGHDSGIYSWNYLHELATKQQSRWQDYLDKLEKAGASREPKHIPLKAL